MHTLFLSLVRTEVCTEQVDRSKLLVTVNNTHFYDIITTQRTDMKRCSLDLSKTKTEYRQTSIKQGLAISVS